MISLYLTCEAMFMSATDGYPLPFEEPEDWSEGFNDFISKCLPCEPSQRWTVLQLIEVLESGGYFYFVSFIVLFL
jgi:hypothetical protein